MSNMINFEKRFRLGVNYWPRHHGVRMWKEWSPEEIDQEFAEMKSVGLDLARIFITWDDFQPIKEYGAGGNTRMIAFQNDESVTPRDNPCMIDPVMIKRFDTLVKIAKKHKIYIEPALITGWMSGVFLESTYRRDRNVYTDPFMLKWQNKLAQFFGKRYRNEKIILAWALGNECSCMMDCPSEEAAWLWTNNLISGLRLFDSKHPITSSMHGFRPIHESKWTIPDQAELCDILTPHPYPKFTSGCDLDGPTDMRTILHAAAESEMYRGLGKKPVLCEETGTLGDSRFSEEESAKFLRLRLYTLLAQGNLGCLWWCHTDFTCEHIVPYKWRPMENDGLGIFDRNGKPKPAAEEFLKFSHVLDAIGGNLPIPGKKAVIIVSQNAVTWLPYFNAYILCKQAGIEADFSWEYDNLSGYKLAICPSVSDSTSFWSEGWENLLSFAKEGGTLYLSYDGASLRKLGETFGIKITHLRKKLNACPIVGFNNLPINFRVSTWESLFDITTAKTVLHYQDKKPALVENKIGKGKTVFFTEPAEMLLAETPCAYANDYTYLVYDYLRRSAGIELEIEINDPQIERTFHPIDTQSAFLVLINHHRKSVRIPVNLKRKVRKEVELLTEGTTIRKKTAHGFEVEIQACSGSIFRLRY